jgi:hypothetical protein
VAVAELIPEKTPAGQYQVHPDSVGEVVGDKRYNSNEALRELNTMKVRTVYRRRIWGERGKQLQARRGGSSATSRNQFDTGGMDPVYVRGRRNVHKKLLIQAAACNLALLMRARSPRQAQGGP